MRMGQSFSTARPIAQHCDELVRRGPRAEERAEQIAAWRRDATRDLSGELGALFPGGRLTVDLSGPETMTGAQVFEKIGPVAANSLLRCGTDDQTVLFSLDHRSALALTDCSFGGDGAMADERSDQPPAQLPRSAAMLIEEIAAIASRVLAAVGGSDDVRGDVLVRSESVTRLRAFGHEDEIACFTLSLSPTPDARLSAILAVPGDRLDHVLPGFELSHVGLAHLGSAQRLLPRDPLHNATIGAFATMPLCLEAVLGELDLTLTRLENLRPGDEFPLPIATELPLRMGEDVVARGTLGTCDNRMALRLTQLDETPATAAGRYRQGNPT